MLAKPPHSSPQSGEAMPIRRLERFETDCLTLQIKRFRKIFPHNPDWMPAMRGKERFL